MQADAHFFNTVRPLFGGRLTQGQVDGMNRIVDYGNKWRYTAPELGCVLGNCKKETANWMEPIREGARRYGPSYSDASAKRAVASIYNKGIIRTNYALPTGPHKQSYYGRGLIQITLWDNYNKFTKLLGVPLDKEPDLALDWDISLDIMFLGMRDGRFRKGNSLKTFDLRDKEGLYQSREIVNGDKARNYGGKETIGREIARTAAVFTAALEG